MYVDHTGELPFLLSLVIAAAVGWIIGSNIGAVIGSNIAVSNSDTAPMDDEEFEKIHDKDTSNLSTEEQIAYERRVRENWLNDDINSNDYMVNEWSEADMVREIKYHDRAYQILVFIGLENTTLATRAKSVDFEPKQNAQTYIFRIIGNAMIW